MQIDLKNLLMEYGCSGKDAIREEHVLDCTLSLMQLRDLLFCVGRILHEDLKNEVYVASVCAGVGNMNYAVVAMQLQGASLNAVGYAKEGILNQRTWEKAWGKITGEVQKRMAQNENKI